MTAITSELVLALKKELKDRQSDLPNEQAIRLHRAISWLHCAQQADNADMKFIALWVSLNACCALDQQETQALAEHQQFSQFIELLIKHDSDGAIYSCLWEEYSLHVKNLIKNPYVFHPFWQSQRQGNEHWRAEFDQSSLEALNALSRQRVADLCLVVLDRLFVLRNQLLYGGATFLSQVNRRQVEDGAGLLSFLMPVIIRIMLNAGDEDWGDIAYPVIK